MYNLDQVKNYKAKAKKNFFKTTVERTNKPLKTMGAIASFESTAAKGILTEKMKKQSVNRVYGLGTSGGLGARYDSLFSSLNKNIGEFKASRKSSVPQTSSKLR